MPEKKIAASRVAPVSSNERIIALDVLRGFALLGILVMNIQGFSMPEAAYFIPTAYGNLDGINRWVWTLSHVLTDQKFMSIFSMLYGAGIVLLTSKLDERGQPALGLHYRRTFWLLVIGLAHAYLLWSGDILVTYALCALIVFWFRRMPPRRLLIIGIIAFLISPLLMYGSVASIQFAPPEVGQEIEAGLRAEFSPSVEEIKAEVAAYRSGWLAQMTKRVPSSLGMQTQAFFFYGLWRAGGLMLIGMALYKWGVFSAQRSARFYTWMMILGLGIGIPLSAYGVVDNFAQGWDVIYSRFGSGLMYNYLASILIALGYVAAIMRMVQTNLFASLQERFAAIGRTALTNYLMQTILATLIFYGFGLGLFGSVPRWGQILIVFLIWAIQLLVAPIWVRNFHFGPFEWLWRSLTYMRPQPIRAKVS